jgi:hypothetical protein
MTKLSIVLLPLLALAPSSCTYPEPGSQAAHAIPEAGSQAEAQPGGMLATKLTAQIHQGMTFKEISRIIPLSTNLHGYSGEHGGVWYQVPSGKNYYLQLRFEHPLDVRNQAANAKTNIEDCILNYPVILKEKETGRIVSIGRN